MPNGVSVILLPAFPRYRIWVVWKHDGSNKFPIGGECERSYILLQWDLCKSPGSEMPWERLHVILFLFITGLGKGLSLFLPQFCHLKKCSMIVLTHVRIQYRKHVMMPKSIKPHINLATKIIPRNQTFHFHVSFKKKILGVCRYYGFFFNTTMLVLGWAQLQRSYLYGCSSLVGNAL